VVTRYEDARAVLSHPAMSRDSQRAAPLHERLGRERGTPPSGIAAILSKHMLNVDPPDHSRLRKLVAAVFTHRRIDDLRPRIVAHTDSLLDQLAGRERADLLADFAYPLPLAVIGDLFGLPEAYRDQFRSWADTIARATDPAAAWQASVELAELLSAVVAERRRQPMDDLLSALIQASDGEARLTEDEVVSMAFLLLSAGHATVAHAIGNGIVALLDHPDQAAKLRAEVDVPPAAVDELLRFQGPTAATTLRFTTEPVQLGELTIPKDEFVIVVLESANHDPERYPDPDVLDLSRDASGHLAFGHGVHFCLGSRLARLEVAIAIGGLLRRFPRLRIAVPSDELRWQVSMLFRRRAEIPVVFDRSAGRAATVSFTK
jgi:cytochrome P450